MKALNHQRRGLYGGQMDDVRAKIESDAHFREVILEFSTLCYHFVEIFLPNVPLGLLQHLSRFILDSNVF